MKFCLTCGGTGWRGGGLCTSCGGRGSVPDYDYESEPHYAPTLGTRHSSRVVHVDDLNITRCPMCNGNLPAIQYCNRCDGKGVVQKQKNHPDEEYYGVPYTDGTANPNPWYNTPASEISSPLPVQPTQPAITLTKQVPCPICRGSAIVIVDNVTHGCSVCLATGKVSEEEARCLKSAISILEKTKSSTPEPTKQSPKKKKAPPKPKRAAKPVAKAAPKKKTPQKPKKKEKPKTLKEIMKERKKDKEW